MSDLNLTKTRLIRGVWHGVLTGATSEPKLMLTHKGEAFTRLHLAAHDNGTWDLEAAVPMDWLADGLQTFIISEVGADEVLASFAFLAGNVLSEDIRAEMICCATSWTCSNARFAAIVWKPQRKSDAALGVTPPQRFDRLQSREATIP
jgi:hypothetical protein